MINLPYNVPLMSQNVPIQTSQNNFQAFHQPRMVTQQMQTAPSVAYPGNLQGIHACCDRIVKHFNTYKQPFYQLHQSDMFFANRQYVPNACPPIFQAPYNVPNTTMAQTQPNYGPLQPNVLEQIRGYASNMPPIFILPSSCHQSANHPQQAAPSQGSVPQPIGQSTAPNYPPSIYYPPSFYPYPIPLPVYEPFVGQARDRSSSCGCFHRRQQWRESKNYPQASCCCSVVEQEEHRCTGTTDDTICSKRNCPASISLQALASQFLTVPGIISCAATRLILRKVPGSNITTTMEDTMEMAQRSISVLTKDQLLGESRTAQQVHALINLHMTTNPPVNIIPLLTLLQLKVNVLKAQVESLINKKVMECQGYGYEVETSGPIDPAVLALKTNAELRQLLSALRQKECDERLNVNFSPYHSQRVIAESRLNSVQGKIRQVEAEFDNRRGTCLVAPTITSRIIQQFSQSRCTFDFAQTRLFEPYTPENALESPDPFSPSPRNPRRLYLKPRAPKPPALRQKDENKATSTEEDGPSGCKGKQSNDGKAESSGERSVERSFSADTCSCDDSASEDTLDESKKKLRPRIDQMELARITSAVVPKDASLLKISSSVITVIVARQLANEQDEHQMEPTEPSIEDGVCRKFMEICKEGGKNEGTEVDESKEDSLEIKQTKRETGEKNVALEVETTTDLRVEAIQGAGPSKSLTLGDEKKTQRGLDSPKQSQIALKDESVEPENVERLKSTEARETDGSPIQSMFKETEIGSLKDDKILRQGAISEDVSREQEIGNERVIRGVSSSSLGQTFCGIRLKLARRRGASQQRKDDSCSNRMNEINSENYESLGKNGKKKNMQIVSMLTSIEYDKRWIVIEDDEGQNHEGNSVNNLLRNNQKKVTEENRAYPSLRKINSSTTKSTMTNIGDEKVGRTRRNTVLGNMFDIESNSMTYRRLNDGEVADGIRYFPPLKYATQNRGATAMGISENIFHQKEIESSSSRAVCDRSTSYHCDTEMGNGIVSAIYSMIESQLVSFGSLLGSIPNLQNILSGLYFDGLSSSGNNVAFGNQENIPGTKENKKAFSRKDNSIFLPDNDDERNASENYISLRERCETARKIRRSILVDKGNKNYALIGGSISEQLRVLAERGLDRPYRVRRSLIIRSRLRAPTDSKNISACARS